MSGNPFRRGPSHQVAPISTPDYTAASSSGQTSEQQPVYSSHYVTPTRPRSESKTKKTVRIRSPEFSPIAPDYTRTSPLPDYRTAVSLPPPTALKTSSPVPPEVPQATSFDPFESRFPPLPGFSQDGEEQVSQNTRKNSGHADSGEGMKAAMLNNPFNNTLATMEAGIASVVPDPQEKLKLAKLDDALPPKAGKTAMDVDSFTRMLLTGKASNSQPGLESQGNSAAIDETPIDGNNRSTDVSLLSRRSGINTSQAPSAESERTSFDELSNAADEDDTHDSSDDEVDPTAPASATSMQGKARQAPPPPKHRYGKSVSAKGPQVVSFDDFTASLKQNLSNANQQDNPDVVDKPLPPLPASGVPDVSTGADLYREKTPTQASVAALSGPTEGMTRSLSQKKTPPPVPLARKHSQMRTRSDNRPRSNSTLTTGSQDSASYPPSIAESTGGSKVPPPPPPTRRHGNTSGTPSTTDLSATTGSRSSLAQALMSSQHSSQSNLSSSPPAPPPPRRRRSSGRNSLDNARNSGEYGRGSFDSTRRSMDSGSVLSTPMEEVPQSNVLADMDAFQREIDDLRRAQNGK